MPRLTPFRTEFLHFSLAYNVSWRLSDYFVAENGATKLDGESETLISKCTTDYWDQILDDLLTYLFLNNDILQSQIYIRSFSQISCHFILLNFFFHHNWSVHCKIDLMMLHGYCTLKTMSHCTIRVKIVVVECVTYHYFAPDTSNMTRLDEWTGTLYELNKSLIARIVFLVGQCVSDNLCSVIISTQIKIN